MFVGVDGHWLLTHYSTGVLLSGQLASCHRVLHCARCMSEGRGWGSVESGRGGGGGEGEESLYMQLNIRAHACCGARWWSVGHRLLLLLAKVNCDQGCWRCGTPCALQVADTVVKLQRGFMNIQTQSSQYCSSSTLKPTWYFVTAASTTVMA